MRAPWMILTVRRRASGVRGLVIGTSRVGMPYYYRSRPPAQVMTRPFLTARWSNVVLLTFEAPEELVRAQVAPGVEPDRWNGKTHVSLVALEMRDVRLRGWRIPGFAAHPQVNLRVYARHRSHAAVAFVRELVPSRLIAAVGRLRFREPFRAARIEALITEGAGGVSAAYRFGLAAPQYHI